jgi:hypothetical protein
MGEQARQDASACSCAWNQALPGLASFLADSTRRQSASPSHHRTQRRQEPLVTICLPHRNSMPFTQERIDSIREQTWQNWECVVVDLDSDDESLPLLRAAAESDSRFRLYTRAEVGGVPALNQALALARGEFIYIAKTNSDLDPSGIAMMADGLLHQPDCGACHTPLVATNAGGIQLLPTSRWNPLEEVLPAWAALPHIRKRPFDALFCAVYSPPCLSISQLLLRRPAIERAGAFQASDDTNSEFACTMRLGATSDILYLPTPVATSRKDDHRPSETQRSSGFYSRMHEIVQDNAKFCRGQEPRFAAAFDDPWVRRHYRCMAIAQQVNAAPLYWRRAWAFASAVARYPASLTSLPDVFRVQSGRHCHDRMIEKTAAFIARHGLESCLRTVEVPADGSAAQPA